MNTRLLFLLYWFLAALVLHLVHKGARILELCLADPSDALQGPSQARPEAEVVLYTHTEILPQVCAWGCHYVCSLGCPQSALAPLFEEEVA